MSKTNDNASRDLAASELEQKGFAFVESRNGFVGKIKVETAGEFSVVVKLPEIFPNAMPEIFIDLDELEMQIPHVEKSGKLCLIPNTGVLIDKTKPVNLISESITRARELIREGYSGQNAADFRTEYLAYWDCEVLVKSLCQANSNSREIVVATLSQDGEDESFFFDDDEQLKNWSTKSGHRILASDKAFFLSLAEAFDPPDCGEPILQSDFLAKIKACSSIEEFKKFEQWLSKHGLPAELILALPLNGKEKVIIGIAIDQLTGKTLQAAQKGFRPGMIPIDRQLMFGRNNPVKKIFINRLDPAYLLTRGGGNIDLLDKTVVVIGCGAIGSSLAMKMASLGIGNIRLVDPETFEPENLHRHELGMADIGRNKAAQLSKRINMKYPHLNVDFKGERIEETVKREPGFLSECALVMIATGDETLGLFLDDFLLSENLPRIHVWVEPLGIGGHVFLTGLERQGCFRCLFDYDPQFGLNNQAAFAQVGQDFQSSFAGCSGVFTPFSSVDADKAANEAAAIAARVLLNREVRNALVSWRGHNDDFVAANLELSRRGALLAANVTRTELDFANPQCPNCKGL